MIFGRKHDAEPEVGFDVMTTDEESLGDVASVHADYLEVTGGTIDRHITYRVPRSAINRIDAQTVYLNVSRGQALAKGWEQATGMGGQPASSANA